MLEKIGIVVILLMAKSSCCIGAWLTGKNRAWVEIARKSVPWIALGFVLDGGSFALGRPIFWLSGALWEERIHCLKNVITVSLLYVLIVYAWIIIVKRKHGMEFCLKSAALLCAFPLSQLHINLWLAGEMQYIYEVGAMVAIGGILTDIFILYKHIIFWERREQLAQLELHRQWEQEAYGQLCRRVEQLAKLEHDFKGTLSVAARIVSQDYDEGIALLCEMKEGVKQEVEDYRPFLQTQKTFRVD